MPRFARHKAKIPFTTLVFGMLLAWAFITLIGFALPDIFDPHIIIASGAAGALMAYVFEIIVGRTRITGEVRRLVAVRRGCFYGGAGYTFFVVLVIIAAMTAEGGLQLRGCGPALVSLAAFGGLGILGGFMFLRVRRAEVERQRAALATQELEIARDLQQRLLPPPLLESDRFVLTARNVPAVYVAGDFYDFIPLTNGCIMIVLADVAGKGVAAGLLMASAKAILPVIATDSPDEVLRRANATLASTMRGRDFVAMLIAIYDPDTRELAIANAGMPDPIVVGRGPVVVSGPRYPIGVKRDLAYQRASVQLQPDDRVLFFSDGLPEATVNGEPLGYEKLDALVRKAAGLDSLFASLEAAGASHDDDWTAVMLTLPAQPRPRPRSASSTSHT